MPKNASDLIQVALKMGMTVEQVIEAASALRRGAADEAASAVPVESPLAPAAADLGALNAAQGGPVQLLDSPLAAAGDGTRIHGLDRYDDLGRLGMGAMGEVRRVRDRQLGRVLAMKTIHAAALKRKDLLARFLEEAQATAQLQHPGIIPVYDMGGLPDGRLWFTMKEVAGTTFGHAISEVHACSDGNWQTSPSGWTLRRLIDSLRQVCEAMGYAHSRGVVHRDLKPGNIMVGSHGEVIVIDWGLAKLLGRSVVSPVGPEVALVTSNRSVAGAHQTRSGQVAGTPAYMSPEQAQGEIDQIRPQSDVYALGAILYTLLSGRAPFTGNSARMVLQQVRMGPPEPLGFASIPSETYSFDLQVRPVDSSLLPIPPPLVEICERAMARSAQDRFESAREMGLALQAWLDGVRRQEAARSIVDVAAGKTPEAEALRARASVLRDEAKQMLRAVKPWDSEAVKSPAWQKEDEATALEQSAAMAELEQELLLHGSLTHDAGLVEAHVALAERYRAEHVAAETAQEDLTRAETLLRRHVTALPADHVDRVRHLAYLKGDGALSLETDPPGAEVLLHRYVLHNRRLVPRFERSLGVTPLRSVSLSMGSYLCVLRYPGRNDVHYPVCIQRQKHWDGVPPGQETPHPIVLPAEGVLDPEDCYMAAGWFQCGDHLYDNSLPRREVWVDARVFRRFPVTNQQFLMYLNALVASGKTDQALRHAPRERESTVQEEGAALYDFDGRRFSLRHESESELFHPDAPVTMVSWENARGYAAWEAARTGLPWRLPGELAWEKACRGVDGRVFPWGNVFDPCFTCSRQSVPGRAKSLPVGRFPVDESVFGVRDLAGGVTDWCADPYQKAGPLLATARVTDPNAMPFHPDHMLERVVRGASWFYSNKNRLRGTVRAGVAVGDRHRDVGFRLARPLV